MTSSTSECTPEEWKDNPITFSNLYGLSSFTYAALATWIVSTGYELFDIKYIWIDIVCLYLQTM